MLCKLSYLLYILGLILLGCSKKLSFEDQISNILVYEEGLGEYTDEQFEKVFKLIEDNPETLDYDFSDELPMDVVTSDDGKVKRKVVRH